MCRYTMKVKSLLVSLILAATVACDSPSPDPTAPTAISGPTIAQPAVTRTIKPMQNPLPTEESPVPTRSAVTARNLDVASYPVIPGIDAGMKSRLQSILEDGRGKSNRPNVFAKIGDSITESGSFLQGIGCRDEVLGDFASLAQYRALSRDSVPTRLHERLLW